MSHANQVDHPSIRPVLSPRKVLQTCSNSNDCIVRAIAKIPNANKENIEEKNCTTE
jgi:hypothetical protein